VLARLRRQQPAVKGGLAAGLGLLAEGGQHADLVYSGNGKWFQFRQAPNPRCRGRRSVSDYTASIDYYRLARIPK